jgi:hypothetical protein
MIHGPMGQNKVSQHRWQKRYLHQDDDCGQLRHDMDLRFDAYESSLHEISRKYLQTAAILESECHRRECKLVSFLSVVPKQQNRTHVSIAYIR